MPKLNFFCLAPGLSLNSGLTKIDTSTIANLGFKPLPHYQALWKLDSYHYIITTFDIEMVDKSGNERALFLSQFGKTDMTLADLLKVRLPKHEYPIGGLPVGTVPLRDKIAGILFQSLPGFSIKLFTIKPSKVVRTSFGFAEYHHGYGVSVVVNKISASSLDRFKDVVNGINDNMPFDDDSRIPFDIQFIDAGKPPLQIKLDKDEKITEEIFTAWKQSVERYTESWSIKSVSMQDIGLLLGKALKSKYKVKYRRRSSSKGQARAYA